jgi:beta-glucosidase
MLAAWRPGEEGGTACARIIFGDVSPSGKLTQAWPTDVGGVNSPGNPWSQPYQADGSDTKTASGPIPASYHDGDSGATQVLFPMGFGLSFSRFNYSQPTIAHGGSATKLSANQSIAVLVTVQNVGDIVAATIVQVYAAASSPGMTLGISRNQRVLVGFIKLRLRAGETAVAKVQVEMADMGRYDPYAHKWVVDAGPYTLFAQDCAGSRWDAYLIHGSPQWQGVGCTVMGSTQVTIA